MLDPQNAQIYKNRGNIYTAKGQLEQAISDYDRAIELNPNNANLYYAKAIFYHISGYNDEALKAYKLFLQVAPIVDPKIETAKRYIQSIEGTLCL